MSAMPLAGRVAFVTGGGRGIGRAISRRLAAAGAAVALTWREREEEARRTADEILAAGGRALALPMEVTRRASVVAAMAEVEAALGPLSILVNNAGLNRPTDFDAVTEEDWDEILAVNLKGPFLCAQTFLALVATRPAAEWGGAIVNIGSVSGQYGGPRTAHYAASKAGLISLAQVVARFGARFNVRCNTVAAGLIASEMAAAGLAAGAVAKAAENILLGRLGLPEEVAEAVLYLASDASAYVTAQTLNVNGGLYF